jgi:tetratricopeptide (TPR) repeat protein
MKSGLWILVVVVITGILVGYALKDRMKPPEPADEQVELKAITNLTDSEAKIDKLQGFISDFPKSELKSRAYSLIAKEMLDALKDTTRFVGFARQTIDKEMDPEGKAMMYYRLYDLKIETRPEEAALIGNELLKVPINAGWLYKYIGYDLAERGRDLDLALSLCQKSVELAQTREDSAACFDGRGFAYDKKAMYKEAIADFENSAKLFGEPYEDVLRHLANAYLKAGESDKAFSAYRNILVTGEYEYARATLDSMMTAQRYSPKKKEEFEAALWQERMAAAKPAVAFAMPTLQGASFSFEPANGDIIILNFMSPT